MPKSPSPSRAASDRARPKHVIDLALQGGGAHGAFTWGVLDRLLAEEDIDIGRISGTSAGALNGAALVTGYARGGRQGAKDNLAVLWSKAWEIGSPTAMLTLPFKKPTLGIWDDAMPLTSPYQVSPFALESLRVLVTAVADFSICNPKAGPQLFVNAVNANTGRTRVFRPEEQSVNSVMASACAPLMFPAVMIDGDAYWDGSYGGNPSMGPLYEGRSDADILLVELTPQLRDDVPMTAKNILNRINELASINGLRSDFRDIQRANLEANAKLRLHRVSLFSESASADAEPSIKRTVGMMLFESLRRKGEAACSEWLSAHKASLGKKSTFDFQSAYL